MEKVGLAGGEQIRRATGKLLLSPDWEKLRALDHAFGSAYRSALLKQGVEYHAATDAPATQPSR